MLSLPSPLVLVIKFSNDGSIVQLEIDQFTNKGNLPDVFTCSKLLSFEGSNTTECTWISDKTIKMKPYGSIKPYVGSIVTLSSTPPLIRLH